MLLIGKWCLFLRTMCQTYGAYCCVPCVRQMVLIAVFHRSGRWCLMMRTICQADGDYCCVPCVRQMLLIAAYNVSGRWCLMLHTSKCKANIAYCCVLCFWQMVLVFAHHVLGRLYLLLPTIPSVKRCQMGKLVPGDSCCLAKLNFIQFIIFDYCLNIFYLRKFLKQIPRLN